MSVITKNVRGQLTNYYSPDEGWVALVDEPLPAPQLHFVKERIRKVNLERLRGAGSTKREYIQNALADLDRRGISQKVCGPGLKLYKSTEATGIRRIFHG